MQNLRSEFRIKHLSHRWEIFSQTIFKKIEFRSQIIESKFRNSSLSVARPGSDHKKNRSSLR